VLVAGMRFGGGEMTIDTAADGLNGGTDDMTFSSAYIVMDITNPEVQPRLLAEIQMPDGSFTTSYPAALTIKDRTSSPEINKWFLTFGSGPTGLDGRSNQNAKIYILDLEEIASPGTSGAAPVSSSLCTKETVGGTGGSMEILACDTSVANSFVGDPTTVDWELDYKADDIYFGIVGDENADSGQVMVMETNSDADTAAWDAPRTFIDTSQPVVSGVTPGLDELGQRWIFFGTGRLFVSADQLSTTTQSIYGVKENGFTENKANLIDVTDIEVGTDGNIIGIAGYTEFDALETAIDTPTVRGWFQDLPPIQGTAGTAPATRVINGSALAGGVLFTTAYQPGLDLCTGEGFSRLYGSYYKTGTAFPDPAVLGTYNDSSGVEYASKFIELGRGFATTPSLHTGSGSGDKNVSVFTQLSTGAIIRTEATTITNVRSGMISWTEK
jgi:type IV pilus assembly protein PilY1